MEDRGMDRRNRGKGGKGGRVEGRRRKRGISKREIVRDTEKSGRCWEHREGQGRVARWACLLYTSDAADEDISV